MNKNNLHAQYMRAIGLINIWTRKKLKDNKKADEKIAFYEKRKQQLCKALNYAAKNGDIQ